MEPKDVFKALNNENNDCITKYTYEHIAREKEDVLKEIIPIGMRRKMKQKLKEYRYCNDMDDIGFGRYIRWIPIKSIPNITLKNGGIVCDLKVIDNSLHIVCKNNLNQLFQLNFDDNIIFSKLTRQELLILDVLNFIDD